MGTHVGVKGFKANKDIQDGRDLEPIGNRAHYDESGAGVKD
jgi:hypothetical protein